MNFVGGGGSGGGGGFKQTPDNLRSTDTFEGILGVGIGPMKGPVNGLKSITLDGTPIEDTSDTLNFQDTVVITADGHPGKFPQIVTPQLGAGGSPVGVNLTLGNTNPAGTPGPFVVKTVSNTGASFLDIRLIVNQLFRQDDKGVYESTANLELQMKPVGATNWITPQLAVPSGTYNPAGVPFWGTVAAHIPRKNYLPDGLWAPETNYGYLPISGKTTSPFVYELRVAVPNTGAYANKGWDVRIRLREPESVEADPVTEKRNIAWESITAVYPEPMGDHEDWRGVAWMQIVGKASDQLSGVPEVAAVYDTKIIQVPPSTIFNPDTRQYTGNVWDGSWSLSYTNDPAWVINDAISDGLSGLSLLAPGSSLNKWDALEASKWFSQLVPDGAGGFHPRYSMNLIVDQVQKADEFIQYMAGAVGGFAWENGNGEWRMVVDKPSNAIDIFTIDNIVGEFQYSHTDVDTRYNDVKLTFLNEEMDYRQDFVQIFDSPAIAQYGRKPTSIVGIGCTNRQEALRRAKLRVRTSVYETRIVNFTTNRRGKMLQQFSTILVADADLGNRTTGRVLSSSGNTITLRDPVRLEVGVNYQIRFALPNPDYDPDSTTQPTSEDWIAPTLAATMGVVNTNLQRGDVTTLYLSQPLPSNVAEYLTVALEAVGLPTTPKLYRVIDLKPSEDGEFIAVTASEVDTGKWDAADNVSPIDSILEKPPEVVAPPLLPASGKVLSLVQIPNNYTLMANWARPVSNWVSGFQVKYRSNGGPWITVANKTTETSLEILSAPTGLYEIEVRTMDRLGRYSAPLIDSLDVDGYDATSLTLSLTNESATLAATTEGVVSDFTPAAGAAVVLYGQVNVTTSATYVILGQVGCVGSINAAGEYTISAMTSDTARLTIQATYNDVALTKVLSLTKVRAAAAGGPAGPAATSAYLTNEAAQVFAYASGNVAAYTGATGAFKVFSGTTDISSNFALSTLANPQALTIVYSNQTYTVTGGFDPEENLATVTIRATGTGSYVGLTFDKVFTLSKVKGGYATIKEGQPRPADDSTTGPIIFDENDRKLYRWTGTAWTALIPAADINGKLTTNQLDDDFLALIAAQGSSIANLQTTFGTTQSAATSAAQAEAAKQQAETARNTAQGHASAAQAFAQAADDSEASAASYAALSAQFTGGGNLQQNTDFPNGNTAGWGFFSTTTGMVHDNVGVNLPDAQWHPVAENVLSVHQSNIFGDASQYAVWSSLSSIAVVPGQFYQTYAYFASHRADVQLVMGFVNDAGTWITSHASARVDALDGGTNPQNWSQLGVQSAQAPAGATRAVIELRKYDTNPGNGDSWAWFWRPYFGAARSGQTSFNNYSPGPYGRTFENLTARVSTEEQARASADSSLASSISTVSSSVGSLSSSVSTQALAIATLNGKTNAYWSVVANAGSENAIIAARAGGGSSTVTMAANKIVLSNTDGSNIRDALVIEGGNVTLAGVLRAQAVETHHIKVGAVDAARLATNELITLTAQIKDGIISTAKIGDAQITTAKIGDLQVETAKIKDLAVETIKIKDGSVTSIQQVYSGNSFSGVGAFNYQVVAAQNVNFNYAGDLILWANLSQGFPSGDRAWNAALYVNGNPIFNSGGAKTADSVALSGRVQLPPGNHRIEVRWAAASSVTLPAGNVSLITLRTYNK